ncbi:MAG TPA: hypothetical protein ENI87_12525 [bacterium]|nr:hypothetical protein [bacterium]
MRFVPQTSLALGFLLVAACAQEPPETWTKAPSDDPHQVPSDFVRFVKVGDGGHLDTAITTYQKGSVKVIFYGAVHIADRVCYQQLNKRFSTCDVLLYELVGPEDYRPKPNRVQEGFNPIGMLQNALKSGLELTFQLDEIDYQAANFVHADMTPEEFEASMAERGESLLSIMFDMMVHGMDYQREQAERNAGGKPEELDLVEAFRTGEGRHRMRVQFAQQLEQMEMLAAGGEGSTLLEGRNQKCLQVLERELGKGHRRIGIYYGAAHLSDMERRLVEDLGFEKVGHEWLQAWDCKAPANARERAAELARRRRCKLELRRLAKQGAAWRAVHGDDSLPKTARELATLQGADGKPFQGPFADPWGRDYVLQRERKNRWRAISAGPDGRLGTEDDLHANEPVLLFGR